MIVCEKRGQAEGFLEKQKEEESLSKSSVLESEPDLKKIALTFDDGPHPVYTREILDGLKERGVKATFFVIGEHAKANPELVQRMKKEGHLVGNHTYTHVGLTTKNKAKFREELQKTSDVLEELLVEEIVYVRPPYGTWDKRIEKDLNLIPVLWTVDSLDWKLLNIERIKRRVLKSVKDGAIILMHDYYETSVEAALEIVDALQEQGYEFVTVDEILTE